uniref:Probable magnesium transporter n=1 Tax=Auxenochlorella protothecoides TaxID=3075 RepID=A0A1D1ZR10_AUXPR
MGTWAIGAAINVVGGIIVNLGTNCIKLGHTRAAAAAAPCPPSLLSSGALAAYLRRPGQCMWLLGMLLFVAGNVLNFLSFAFAAQSLLAALAVVQFVANVVFARLINGEVATRRVLCATGVVIVGCVLLVAFGNHESPVMDADDLRHLYTAPAYIGYLVGLLTLAVVAAGVHAYGRKAYERGCPKWHHWVPLAFAVYAAALGTQSIVYGKSLAMLLRKSLQGPTQLTHWYTYVALLLFLAFAAFWVVKYSEAMRRFPVLTMMPMLMIMWVLISMLSGMVYFQEYRTFTVLSTAMFVLGSATLLGGIYLLATCKEPLVVGPTGSARPSPQSSTGASCRSAPPGQDPAEDLAEALWGDVERSDSAHPGAPAACGPRFGPTAAAGRLARSTSTGAGPPPAHLEHEPSSPPALPLAVPVGALQLAQNPVFDMPCSPGPPSCRLGAWRELPALGRASRVPGAVLRPSLALQVDCGGGGEPAPRLARSTSGGSEASSRVAAAAPGVLSPILSIFSMPGGAWDLGAPTPQPCAPAAAAEPEPPAAVDKDAGPAAASKAALPGTGAQSDGQKQAAVDAAESAEAPRDTIPAGRPGREAGGGRTADEEAEDGQGAEPGEPETRS